MFLGQQGNLSLNDTMRSFPSLKTNYLLNILNQALSVSLSVFTAPYLSRVLEADGIGEIAFTTSVVSYFSLFAVLGTAASGQREVSYAQDDRKKRSNIFWNHEALSLLTSFFCLIVYGVWIVLFGKRFRLLYAILSLQIIGNAFDITWLFSGMENFAQIVRFSVIFKFINFVSIFLFIHTRDDIYKYVFLLQAFSLVNFIAYWRYLPQYVDRPVVRGLKPLKCVPNAVSLFVPTIAASVYTMMDKMMIGLFSNATYENGYYEQSQKIPTFALSIITSLAAVVMPRLGFCSEKGDVQQIQAYMKKSFHFVWMLGFPICMGLVAVSDNLVPWFFGEGYDKVKVLMKINAFLVLAIGINRTAGSQYMLPLKKQKMLTWSILVGAGCNLALNSILIPKYFSIGAAAASVFAEFTIGFTQLYMLRKELPVKDILFCSKNYMVASIIMMAMLNMIRKNMQASIWNTCILIFAGSSIYFAVLFILRDAFFCSYLKYYKEKVRDGIKKQ